MINTDGSRCASGVVLTISWVEKVGDHDRGELASRSESLEEGPSGVLESNVVHDENRCVFADLPRSGICNGWNIKTPRRKRGGRGEGVVTEYIYTKE